MFFYFCKFVLTKLIILPKKLAKLEKRISFNWFFSSNSLPNRSRDVLGSPGTKDPRSRDKTGQDLETSKVPWSRCPGTKEVQKSRDLKMEKVPEKMPTLVLRMYGENTVHCVSFYNFENIYVHNFINKISPNLFCTLKRIPCFVKVFDWYHHYLKLIHIFHLVCFTVSK